MIGAITVPIMVFSIKLLPQIAQLHPEVIEKGGLAPEMGQTLAITVIPVLGLQFLLLYKRYQLAQIKDLIKRN